MAAWGRGCGPHPNPLPEGEGVMAAWGRGCGPHPNPSQRESRWRPGAVGVALTPTLSQRERGSMAAWPWVWPSPQPSPRGRGGRWRPGAVGVALTPTLSQRERGSMAAWGRGCGPHPNPLPEGEGVDGGLGRGCGPHPNPLPEGEGVDGGLGPWVWLSPQPSPRGRGGRRGVKRTSATSHRDSRTQHEQFPCCKAPAYQKSSTSTSSPCSSPSLLRSMRIMPSALTRVKMAPDLLGNGEA